MKTKLLIAAMIATTAMPVALIVTSHVQAVPSAACLPNAPCPNPNFQDPRKPIPNPNPNQKIANPCGPNSLSGAVCGSTSNNTVRPTTPEDLNPGGKPAIGPGITVPKQNTSPTTSNPNPNRNPDQNPDMTRANRITSAADFPANAASYAPPFDVVRGSGKLLIDVSTSPDNSVTAVCGTDNPLDYTFGEGYAYRSGKWEEHALTSTSEKQPIEGQWHTGKLTTTFAMTADELKKENFFISFVCHWDEGEWKCGCKDKACAVPSWNVQMFGGMANKVQATPTPSKPNPATKDSVAGACEMGKQYTYNSQYNPPCKCPAGSKTNILNPGTGNIMTVFECVTA